MTKFKYGLRQHPKQKFDQDDQWISSTQQMKTNKNKNKNRKNKQISNNNNKGASGNDLPEVGGLHDGDDNDRDMDPETTLLQTEEKVFCIKCQLVCKNKMELALHEKSCLKVNQKESFLKYIQPRVMVEDISKVALPLTQETVEIPEGENSTNKASTSQIDLGFPGAEGSQPKVAIKLPGAEDSQPKVATKKQANQMKSKKEQHNRPTQDRPVETELSTAQNENASQAYKAYEEITKWRRNLFRLPKGNIGKQFVDEMTRLINKWNTTKEEEALVLLMCMPNLLLQKTSAKGKAREHKENLRRRMELWQTGNVTDLVKEGKTIQQRLCKTNKVHEGNDADILKSFRNHMIQGNLNAAVRLLNKNNCKGVLPMTLETIEQLHEKHPNGEPINTEMILEGPIEEVNPVIFHDINADLVKKVVLKMKGAAGPSCFDADDWRGILGSRIYGSSTDDLCNAIATMAIKLCTENCFENGGISPLVACRLIPLDKDPGLRPIGIGEVLRRIIGKMVVLVLRPDIQEGAGELQMCVGQQGGCEAGVHAMYDLYQEEDTHGIIQVDANNAFNVINRKVFLHNIQIICPAISNFIKNCYTKPPRLFVLGGVEIASKEGTTQGAPSAMPTYALGIKPLLICLGQPNYTLENRENIQNTPEDIARQAAFADDLASCGTIEQLKIWWDIIIKYGPYLGYYAKPSKSWLIVKIEYLDYAKEVFAGTGIQITTEGNRHLGAVVGTESFKDQYVTEKVEEWIEELEALEAIAQIDPHIAYCAYVFAIQHRYNYVLRTIPNITEHLLKLDEAIDKHLVKQLFKNHEVTQLERTWISLPPRLGGLGISIISEIAPFCYQNSRLMTEGLVNDIKNQHKSDNFRSEEENGRPPRLVILEEKKKREEAKVEYVKGQLNPSKLKVYEAITEKGASSWLNTLPIKEHDFYLDKQTFWDTIRLRYGIELARLPSKCVCDTNFTVEHALNCKKGGFICTRHNDVRDFTAELLSEVCKDVSLEPLLTPLTGETFRYRTANTDEHARLDVSARDVWMRGSKAYFDIKVFNPLAQSYSKQTLAAAHKSNENSKKRLYGERVINVEHGSFTPLVFSCLGGMSVECSHFFNRMADKLSEKRDISISKGRTWVRTKLSFCLLRSTHMCIRGSRTRKQFSVDSLSETDIHRSLIEARIEESTD